MKPICDCLNCDTNGKRDCPRKMAEDSLLKLTINPQTEQAEASSLSDLLCCPTCASKRVQVIKGNIGNRKIWKVFCATCQVRTGPEYSLRKAKEVWNKRAI